jgi:hypothetical protein
MPHEANTHQLTSRSWVAALLVVSTLPAVPAAAATLTWNNVNGDWTIGTNWTPSGPPGTGDVAVVNVANPQLNTNTTILGLNQGGGTISGTATLTVTGPSTWTAGTHTGTGTTQFDGTLAISGAGTKSITGGRTVNAGNTTWSGNTGSNNNDISIASTSVFNNTGTFAETNAFASTMTGGTFNNSDTFNKESATTTTISTVFNNTGTVNVDAGTMLMQSGGTSTGIFAIDAGAKLEFRNGTHVLNNVTTSGAGTLEISTENVGADALVTVNGGTLNSAFLMSGSVMNGTDQVFLGPATWTGGAITGLTTQSTTFAGSLTISGALTKTLTGGRDMNAGNTTWTGNTGNGNNVIGLSSGGIFTNTGTFTDSNAFDSSMTGGTFANSSTFNKQSATTTSMASVFNNTGTVNVNAGTMLMNGGGTDSGVFNIADGAKLEFRNGAHTLNNVTTSGLGTFQISTENVGADASVVLNGGTHTSAFLLSGSTLSGTDHTFQGAATWTGGTITGPATESTTFASSLTISGATSKTLSGGREVIATGITTWTGNTGASNNAIGISGGSDFSNTGTFADTNTFNSAINVGGGGGAFTNSGTFNKQSATTTAIGTAFNNTGTVNVNAGTMLMNGGGTDSGVFNIADGAKLEFRNGAHTLNNVTTSGAGIFQISTENVGADATVTVNGGTHTTPFLLSGSAMNGTDHTFQGPVTWTGGSIGGDGLTTFESTTFQNDVTISGANLKTLVGGRTLNLQGTTTWSGNTGVDNNTIRFWNGATINNNGTFNDANAFDSFVEHNVGGPHNFNNIGTYNKQTSAVTDFDQFVNFNNTGQVNVNAGTLRIANAVDNQGTITTATGATFASTSGGANLQNHGVLQGTGTYDPGVARAVQNFGQVQPGTPTSVGELLIAGDYTQDTVGLIEFNLASLTDFDTMDVIGNLSLNGTVHVSSLGGYNPNDGDTFTIITFDDGVMDVSDLVGVFSDVTWTGFNPGVSFTALYFEHSVVLSATNAVPLPASVWLLGTGVAGIFGLARRRRRAETLPR